MVIFGNYTLQCYYKIKTVFYLYHLGRCIVNNNLIIVYTFHWVGTYYELLKMSFKVSKMGSGILITEDFDC